MTRQSLNGQRKIGSVPPQPFQMVDDIAAVTDWLPASVPGDIRLDLFAAGLIPDPYFGDNAAASHWVDNLDWWYHFTFTAAVAGRSFLHFSGVDYLSAVYCNSHCLGLHEGMFSSQVYEVTELLRRENDVAVRVWGAHAYRRFALGPGRRLWRWLAKRLLGSDLFPDRLATLKCQMTFGWDFAPHLPTMGIWDDVYLEQYQGSRIRSVFPSLRPELADPDKRNPVETLHCDSVGKGLPGARCCVDSSGSSHKMLCSPARKTTESHCNVSTVASLAPRVATVDLRVDIDVVAPTIAKLEATLEGQNFPTAVQRFSSSLDLRPGQSTAVLPLLVQEPRFWQPWDRGFPHLYRLRVSLAAEGVPLDSLEQTLGLRRVDLVAPADGAEALTLAINGAPTYLRGANWVPADALFGRLRDVDYQVLIDLAKEANINLLRVWGGGLREKQAFYDACDAAGIMVWQEFPLACAFLDHFPRDAQFRQLVEDETREIVRQLRHHPSLILWCGGNEFSPRRNAALVSTMRRNVEFEDGTRPFRPASPAGGDHHNWRVWHGKANVGDYQKDRAVVLSEFGLQSVPNLESLRRFLPEGSLRRPDRMWNAHRAQIDKLQRYAAPYAPADPAAFILATQRAQAQGLQVAIEHLRRRKGATSGVLFWQFNEPWGAIGWSILDYYRQPKLAYHKVRELYSPVLISIDYPLRRYQPGDRWHGVIHAINDTPHQYDDCRLSVTYAGEVQFSQDLDLFPDSAEAIGEVNIDLRCLDRLDVELRQGEEILSTNSYDLTYFDPRGISRRDAVRNWLAWRMLH